MIATHAAHGPASLPSALAPRTRRRLAALLLACVSLVHAGWPAAAWAQSPNALPALGDPATTDLSVSMERRVGEQIMREVRRDPDYLDDPVLLEYVRSLWQPLVEAARARGEIGPELDLRYPFEIFLVRDPSVNAFALPGGFVGVHLGLIAVTTTRDELAAVLAHELSHVTQRHIARSIAPTRQASILGLVATILGMIAASRSGDPNAGRAVLAAGQGAAIQAQLNFSRDMEREADRVGYGLMTQAGYSPGGMASMFEKLDRASRFNDSGEYPYLRSHPLTIDRIGEARSRTAAYGATATSGNVLLHATMRARARVLMDSRADILRRLELAAPAAGAASVASGLQPDAGAVQLPAVSVVASLAERAERLATAYSGALASTLLHNWASADLALVQAHALASAAAPADRDPPLREVKLLQVQSLLERGDARGAAAVLAPLLAAEPSRPALLLQARVALADPAKASPAGQQALRSSAEALQTWVATHPGDATAWRTLGQVWAPLDQPLRALRAEAEADLAIGDLRAAIERLRAAQRLARSSAQVDFIELSVVDARLRALEAQRRELIAEQNQRGGLSP